ncbi:MAG: hypothetical protein IKM31_02585 [Oscillospiraceae bacterium]|nr:hypothetical protein [Oscillospiraceae bacterium]
MEKLITYPTLRNFAYSNDQICKKPIRGIALSFFGLGGKEMFTEDTDLGLFLAEKGIVLLIPYTNPWSWMNRQAVAYTDELIDVIMAEYSLPEDTPIVSTGGSMGGQSALVYAAYAKRTPAACVANCPVCDLPYHFTERPDLPRTLYSAFGEYDCSLEEALRSASPLHLAMAGKMPDISYTVFHCEEDKAVNKQMHSDRFVKTLPFAVSYHAVPERGHCDLPDEFRAMYNDAIVSACLGD